LAQQVLSRYLEDDTRFIEAVNLGLDAAERGRLRGTRRSGSRTEKNIAALMRLRWTAPATHDLYRIVQRIQQDNFTAAAEVARTLYDGCGNLKRFPYRGREGRIEGTRELVFPGLPYVAVTGRET
jgi:toxin ParE1/3/4